jgi:Ran GTPase-activating protein (RanGAP) involved in mRNA processing and transport
MSKYTKNVLYKYNLLYGNNSQNLIRTYSPKMRPKSSSVKVFMKTIKDSKEDIYIFTEDEILLLIKSKCQDIGIDFRENMYIKFKDFCNSKCKNRYVDLTENYLGLKSINFLGNILYNTDRISKLNLSKNNLGDIGVERLMNSIKNSKSLIYLNISSNGITYKGGESIFKNMINHQSIIDFNICTIEGSNKNRNRLTSVGIKDIELYLKNNRLIEFLNICGNSIKNEGFILVCKGMNDNHSINSLNISHNEIEEKGIIQGLKYIKSSIKQLTFLDISKNNIMNDGVITLTNKLKFFPNLYSLNVSFCGFEFKGFRHLIKSLQYNRKIEKLNVSGNRLKSKNFDSIKTYFSFI